MIGRLGNMKFVVSEYKVLSFQEYTRKIGIKTDSHEIINSYPLLEVTGWEQITSTLEIELSTQRGLNPRETFHQFRRAFRSMKPQHLVIGSGYYGAWIIKGIETTEKRIDNNGIPWFISMKLDLVCSHPYF